MAIIYYKDPQTSTFTSLTYKDFNAASIWHTHTWNDIKVYEYDQNNPDSRVEIPQILNITDGGANIEPSAGKTSSSGIYTINTKDNSVKQIFAKNGVLGYFNGENEYPSFDIWPIVNGGTGATSQKEVLQTFQITAPFVTLLDYRYTTNAYITNGKTQVWMSFYLPYQLPVNKIGYIELYAKIINQPGTTTTAAAHGTDSFMYGFTATIDTSETSVTTNDCIYKYEWDGTATVGAVGDPLGNVTTRALGGTIIRDNDQLVYREGGVITITMDFTDVFDSDFKNNTPVLIVPGYAIGNKINGIETKPLHSKIVI